MAFELKDFFRSYVKRGDQTGLFNVARDDTANAGARYYAYQNEDGSYIIQCVTTSGTLHIYAYYASKHSVNFNTDWTGRAGLTYVEYYQLFHQE